MTETPSFIKELENANKAAQDPDEQPFTGTFREFLQLYQGGEYPNMGVLSHARIYNMIIAAGTSKKKHFGRDRISYKFFEDHLFGVEETIDAVMSYIHSAAQRTETSRRMLVIYGPPSAGKSMLINLIKRGLEDYSKTKDGAIFAIKGSKMHENPFLLVPYKLRHKFAKEYNLKIEGTLSPPTQYMLDHEYNGRFMDVPIERIFISESARIGIGTYLPQDPKSSDQSELVGGLDFARIQEYGSESHPLAYNFDGELNIANRGIMELVEGMKADERFLRVLLTATEEKAIKAPRFGFIYIDSMIVIHTNETEFEIFMREKKYEAYHDRMVIVRASYNSAVDKEVNIYEKLIFDTDAIFNMHIAPRTLEAAATFAVLSRLNPEDGGDFSIIKKMKLYNSKDVRGYKTEQVPDIKRRNNHEAMSGVSPRFVNDQLTAAISKARTEERDYITALDILRQLNSSVRDRDSFKQDEKNLYANYIDMARSEWNEMLRNDIQKAFFVSFAKEAKNLCDKYLDHVEAICSGTKPRDPVTNEEIDIDENLMDEIEGHIDISNSGKEDFRNEIMRAFGSAARRQRDFDYTQHTHLREAINKQLFQERRNVIRLTVSARNPDPEALQRINDVVDRMVTQQGYSAGSANELLKYASSHLFDK